MNIDEMQTQRDALDAQIQQAMADKARAELKARREAEAKERDEHYARMYSEIGQPLAGLNEAQHAIVYGQAYAQGHSSGYGEVELYYGEYAEMARKLIDAI